MKGSNSTNEITLFSKIFTPFHWPVRFVQGPNDTLLSQIISVVCIVLIVQLLQYFPFFCLFIRINVYSSFVYIEFVFLLVVLRATCTCPSSHNHIPVSTYRNGNKGTW